jgi:hypothetical protein
MVVYFMWLGGHLKFALNGGKLICFDLCIITFVLFICVSEVSGVLHQFCWQIERGGPGFHNKVPISNAYHPFLARSLSELIVSWTKEYMAVLKNFSKSTQRFDEDF